MGNQVRQHPSCGKGVLMNWIGEDIHHATLAVIFVGLVIFYLMTQ